jgi:hypothetical protein
MVLSLNQNFREALEQAQSEPVIVADFDLGGVTLGKYRIHNYSGRLFDNTTDDIGILSTVTPISREVDPITRKVGYSTITMEVVDDGTIRDWSGRFDLQGARVTLRYGFAGLSISDYLVAFVGVIDEILPDAGMVTITLSDLLGAIYQRPFGGLFVGKHPVEVIEQLLTHSSDLIVSGDFNSTDFDPTTYSSSISHFNMTSISPDVTGAGVIVSLIEGFLEGKNEPPSNVPSVSNKLVPVGPIIDEICEALQATILISETGEIRFKLFDSSTASSRTLTTDDFDDVNQAEAFTKTINKIDIEVKNSWTGFVYKAKDATSITAVGNYEHKFAANLSAPVSHTTTTPLLNTSSTALQVDSGMITGFTGLRGTVNHRTSFTPATDAGLSGARSATILATQGYRGLTATFTTTTAATVNFNDITAVINMNDDGTVVGGLPVDVTTNNTKVIRSATYTGGTTTGDTITGIPEYDGGALDVQIVDATQIKRYTEIILDRFSRGAIVLDVRVSLRHIDLELGDLIELSTDIPLLNSGDFASSSPPTAKFEITKKEIDFTADSPAISLRLVQATLSTFSPGPLTIDTDIGFNQFRQGFSVPSLRPAVSMNGIVDGLEVSSPSGLDILVDSGVVANGAGGQLGTSNFHTTVPASSDSYIRYDSNSGAFQVDSVANGADEPASPGMTMTTLAKVVSGASSVSSVVDLRSFGMVGPLQTFRGVRAGFDALANGSFEAWSYGPAKAPDTWAMANGAWGTDAVRHSANVLDGFYSVKIPSSSSVVGVTLKSDYIPVKALDVYLVTAGFKAASASGVRGELAVEYFDSSRTFLSDATVELKTLSTSWSQIGGAISPPASTAFMKVKVSRTTTGTDVYIDDVRLETGSPKFNAYQSADVTLSTSVSEYVVIFDTEFVDLGSWYDNTTGIATAPVSGVYEIKTTIYFYSTGSATDFQVHLDVNGSSYYQFGRLDTIHYGAIDQPGVAHFDGPISLNAGDQIRIRVKDNGGAAFKAGNVIRGIGSIFSAQLNR